MKRKRKRAHQRADADVDLAELDADAELATQVWVSDPALILRVAMVSAVEDADLADAK